MLTKTQEKLIRSLHLKKSREKSGLCLVEGEKNIQSAGQAIQYTFRRPDTKNFDKLVTTETPQAMAAVAKLPTYKTKDIEKYKTIIMLDSVQDPGNVGAIFRLCLGFDASLILVNSADPGNPKVIRSSAGAMFLVPWVRLDPAAALSYLNKTAYKLIRLENKPGAKKIDLRLARQIKKQPTIFIAGSEGHGIKLQVKAPSIYILHNKKLESLNVSTALAVLLEIMYALNS